MSKVEQKVSLDATEYRKNIKSLATETRKETDKVNGALDDSGNAVRDFNERVEDNTKKSAKSFNELFKGIKGGLGGLGLAGVGLAVGSTVAKTIKESLDFSDILNKISVKTGQNAFEQAEFRNQLLGVSARTNVDEEQVAAAAESAIAQKASTKEAAIFAEVIAKASKSFKDVDPGQFAEDIAKDIRARGLEVTGEAAQRTVEALLVGVRSGFQDINAAFEATRALPGRAQERAGLTQRDLINLFAGGQGVAADPELVNEAIRGLIAATDKLESRAAVQGILGTKLRDTEGNFNLTAESLDQIAAKLKGIGDEVTQRAVLEKIPGISPEAAEGILALVQDRAGFQRERERTQRDQPKLDDAFKKATEGFLESVSSFFNKITTSFKTETRFAPQTTNIRTGVQLGLSEEQREAARGERSRLALPGGDSPTQRQRERKPAVVSQQGEMNVNVNVTVDSKDPAFIANPKSTDLSRNPGGF